MGAEELKRELSRKEQDDLKKKLGVSSLEEAEKKLKERVSDLLENKEDNLSDVV